MRWLLSISSAVLLTIAVSLPSASFADYQEDGIRIIRDEYGVPHIYADSHYDLWYGVGYSQAQDRLWQADLLRRNVKGTLAELLGPSAVEGDIFARTVFGTDAAREQMLAQASEQTRVQFQAFADGFNAWIAEAATTGQLPVEYQGAVPVPWQTTDSVAVLQLIFLQFGQDGADELDNAAQLQSLIARYGLQGGLAIFSDTHWLNDGDAYTSVPAGDSGQAIQSQPTLKQRAPEQLDFDDYNHRYHDQEEGYKRNLRQLGIHKKAASNAIVISPRLSADGHALLLGGPQMGHSVPQISLEMSIHQDDFNVHGISFAGVPGISIGTTRYFSWSFTSGVSDNADFYLDSFATLQCRPEIIHVRYGSDVTQTLCETVHGPVVGIDAANGIAVSLKSAVRGQAVRSLEALQAAQHARSIEDIDAQMANWAPNFNMLIADVKGNIAYRHLGFIPIRAATDNPWLPHNGDGSSEWQGYIPYDQLPRSTNPAQGWLVSWNNKPRADWNNSLYDFGSFGPVQRVDALVRQLQALQPGSVTLDTLAEINKVAAFTNQTPSHNSIGIFTPKLLQRMLAQVDSSADPRLAEAVSRLASWNQLQLDSNSDGRYDDPAVAIFDTWYSMFTSHAFADELAAFAMPGVMANLSYRLLDSNPSQALLYPYLGTDTVGNAVTSALIQTLDQLQADYGSANMDDWQAEAAVLDWSQMGAVDVPNGPWMNRGTYNQLLHMGYGREMYGMNVVAPGQSGNPFSPHFHDQLMMYYTMTYKPMNLNKRMQMRNADSVVTLTP